VSKEKQATRCNSRRIYALWGAGIALLLALGLFCWLLVLPVLKVHTQLEATVKMRRRVFVFVDLGPAVERLGGSDRAANMLCLYLRLPDCLTLHRAEAVEALAVCKKPRTAPQLTAALDHKDDKVKWLAALSLAHLAYKGRASAWPSGSREQALVSLTSRLRDKSVAVRAESAGAIAHIDPTRLSEMTAFMRQQPRKLYYGHAGSVLRELERMRTDGSPGNSDSGPQEN
jgi:HEAT repeats